MSVTASTAAAAPGLAVVATYRHIKIANSVVPLFGSVWEGGCGWVLGGGGGSWGASARQAHFAYRFCLSLPPHLLGPSELNNDPLICSVLLYRSTAVASAGH